MLVNDGSTDGTLELCERYEVTVISHDGNSGYGAAIKTGLSKAHELKYKYAITIDADGQHNASDVVKIFDLLEDGCDLVCGNRHVLPQLAEQLFALYSRWQYKIDDPLCGFKGYRLSSCSRFIRSEFTCVAGTGIAISAARAKFESCEFFNKSGSRKRPSSLWDSDNSKYKDFICFFFHSVERIICIKI